MGHRVLPPEQDIIAEAAALLEAGSERHDYSENLVVFPGKRPAHFLRRLMAEREQSAFIPPAILSMEEFVDRTYEGMSEAGQGKLEAIDAVAFLFELHRSMDTPIGGAEFLSLEAFFPLGLRIFHDLEELVIEDIDRDRLGLLDSVVDQPVPVGTRAKLQSLSYFFERFYPAIRTDGLSSRSERYSLVGKSVTRELVPWRKIIFAGFYGLTACERLLFKKLLSWREPLLLFQDGPGLKGQLHLLGLDWQETKEEGRQGPTVHFHEAPDVHGETFSLSGRLKGQVDDLDNRDNEEGNTPGLDRTVVVLPSPETLFPVLYHALPAVGSEDYNISLGYPLERTPTWGFLTSLVHLVASMDGGRFYIPDYLSFVLHPYAKNIYLDGQSEITRIMFHALEERLLAERTKGFVSLDELEKDEAFFQTVHEAVAGVAEGLSPVDIRRHLATIHDELIRRATSFDDIGDFAGKIMAVLTFVYDHSSARLHPFFHPFAETFLEQLDLLKGSRVKGLSFSENHSYFRFLRRYIANCITPFDGTPLRGLQVLGFLETRNLKFDRVYVLDMNEGIIPDSAKENTFIPVRIRQALGLPTYKDRDQLSAYYFDTLLKGSRETHLFYVENDRKEKSRFVEKLLWERQVKENAESSLSYVSSLSYSLSLDSGQPKAIQKSPDVAQYLRSRVFDATSLNRYLRCPLQFYYESILKLSKRGDQEADVERVDIGSLIHDMLRVFFDKRRDRVLTVDDMDLAEMDSLAIAMFSDTYGPDPIGAVFLLRQQIRKQMEAFLRDYMMPLVAGIPVRIMDLERRLEIAHEELRFRGVLDRVDLRADRICIIDYKTGGSAGRLGIDFDKLDPEDRRSWPKAIGSIQLPLYLLLFRESQRVAAESDSMFILLGRARIDQSIEMPVFDEKTDRQWAYETMKKVIVGLTREIIDPGSTFDPGLRAEGACGFCDYRYLCGTQWQGG